MPINGKRASARKVTVSADVKNYSDDPFFVKKAEVAKAMIEKIGLPKEKWKYDDFEPYNRSFH
jgi:hypothetical protein